MFQSLNKYRMLLGRPDVCGAEQGSWIVWEVTRSLSMSGSPQTHCGGRIAFSGDPHNPTVAVLAPKILVWT